ncbi:pentapeptide repeat-containing protein [Streptomyces albiflavescens]|uniref:pentapeptide repeat-containing protein n=1 Tax=Streptomyces albiflavescens TaxID=1623582 RepID=UPI0016649F42|nr:pentapeptide repeat-containing protein [Streptomyces albiflavescens]
MAAAVWITTALLMPQTDNLRPDRERTRQRIDVVRTALAAGAGVGASVTVLLALRRQHHHETATAQTEHDAAERRITELYTKAVEQLGSPQAPVRLGGLYALERLGQTAPDHRQTIVDVICAYLRMPYTPPADPTPRHGLWPAALSRAQLAARALIRGKANDQRHQELQVRMTAQHILAAHLRDTRPPDERENTQVDDRFWEGLRIDVAHATLTHLDFSYCHVAEANFSHATFIGKVLFEAASFTGDASFLGATFAGDASFLGAEFADDAWFVGATFAGHCAFADTTFTGPALFDDARFTGDAWFAGATFTFNAVFNDARFTGNTSFDDATFTDPPWFGGAAFTGNLGFEGAQVTRLVTPEGDQIIQAWPPGWVVRPAPGGGGILQKTDTEGYATT